MKVSKGQSQPDIVADIRLLKIILYMVLGRPFSYRVLIAQVEILLESTLEPGAARFTAVCVGTGTGAEAFAKVRLVGYEAPGSIEEAGVSPSSPGFFGAFQGAQKELEPGPAGLSPFHPDQPILVRFLSFFWPTACGRSEPRAAAFGFEGPWDQSLDVTLMHVRLRLLRLLLLSSGLAWLGLCSQSVC